MMIDQETKYNKIIKKLQDKDYRLTNIRKAIIKIFVCEKDISINDIITKLKKNNSNVNIMSVYNTIALLMNEHIIHSNIFKDKQVYYELSEDNVVHVICNICNKAFHFDDEEIKQLPISQIQEFSSKLAINKEILFSHLVLELHGICVQCQKQTKNL